MTLEKTYQCLQILKEACDLLRCPVCLEIIKETVELSCRHRICRSCYSSITTQYTDLKCCPLCKKAIVRRARIYRDLYADEYGRKLHDLVVQLNKKYNVNVDLLSGFDDFKNNIENSENCPRLTTIEKHKHNAFTTTQLQKCDNKNSSRETNKLAQFSMANKRIASKQSLDALKSGKSVSKNKPIPTKNDGNIVRNNANIANKKPGLWNHKTTLKNSTLDRNSKDNEVRLESNRAAAGTLKKSTTQDINEFDLLLSAHQAPKSRRVYVNRSKVPKMEEKSVKLLEFEDNENKVRVLEWLNDNANLFGRLTQTQVQDSEGGTSQPFNLPSVSQQNRPRILNQIDSDNFGKVRKNGSNDATKNRAKSLDVSDRKQIPLKFRRHSFAGGTPEIDNYQIDEYNTEEEKLLHKVEEIALIDIIEDEYLNKIDKDLFNKPLEDKLQNICHTDTKARSKMKERLSITNQTKRVVKQNKAAEDSGWERMKHIRRTIRKKEKVPKKLNITLQTTQNTSKNETQKSENTHSLKSVEKSKVDDKSKNIKTFDLNKLETYISENIQKVQTVSTQSTNEDNINHSNGRINETVSVNLTQNESNDNSAHYKSNDANIQNHSNVNIDGKDHENVDVLVKKERLSCNSNENTRTEENLYHQATQHNENNREKSHNQDFNIDKYVGDNNEFPDILNKEIAEGSSKYRQNNLNDIQLDIHHVSSHSRNELANNEDYDVFNQPTQKIVYKTPSAQHTDKCLDLQPKLQQGLHILDSLEEVLKSVAIESAQKGADMEMLSLPSKLENAPKPVTLFLNHISQLSKLHPIIDQLRDLFHDIQTTPLKTSGSKTLVGDVINQTDKEDTQHASHSPVMFKATSKNTSRNYLSCLNMSVQTVNVNMSSKQVQTDHETPEGFLISANDFFGTEELKEMGIQTDELSCPKCNYAFKETSASLGNCDKGVPTPTSQKEHATGKYTLTEFFDDINFETQDIIKQVEEKRNATVRSQDRITENSNPSQHVNKSTKEQCESNAAHVQKDVVVVDKTSKKINDKVETGIPKTSANSQSSSVLEISVPSSIRTKKRRRIEVLNSDSDSEDNKLKKRPHNKFLPDEDLSVVFCSEESPHLQKQSHHSDESEDTFNYEEYIRQALTKYDNDGVRRSDSQSTSKAVNTDSNVSKSKDNTKGSVLKTSVNNEFVNGVDTKSKDKENISPNRYCDTPEKPGHGIRKRKVVDLHASDESSDDCIKKKINFGPSTSKHVPSSPPVTCVENKCSDEMADNIFLDEQNMARIERDLNAFEKVDYNVNSEDTDIIAATEHNIDYYKIDKQISNRANENLEQKCRNSLSENMFNDSLSCTYPAKVQQKDNAEIQRKLDEIHQKSKIDEEKQDKVENVNAHLLNEMDMNVFLESDSDQDTEVIANTDDVPELRSEVSKQGKVTVLQNITLANEGSVQAENNLEDDKDDISDTDIVDTTPQKEKRPIDIRSNLSQRSLIMEFPLPPPPGFGDDEVISDDENEGPTVLPDYVDNLNDHHISTEGNADDALNSSSVLGNSKEVKEDTQNFRETKRKMVETSTPFSGKLDSENVLSLSPIPARGSALNVIELVKQSKFTPLSISVRPSPQSQKSLIASTPKQKSILNYVVKSEDKKSDIANTKPCIGCTRLSKEQVISISLMTNKKLASYSNNFTDKVTHMIVSVTDRNCVKDHTMKYVLAIASGIWVLNYQWILECLAANSIIAEEPFEVLDVSGIPGPKTSRLTRKTNPLLVGFKFHAAPPFQSTTQDDVEKVISLLGGKVVAAPEDLLEEDGLKGIIITEASATQDFEMYEVWLETLKVVTVDIEWLSKSVGQYNLVSLRSFALCSDDSMCDLGYPEALIGEPLSYPPTAS